MYAHKDELIARTNFPLSWRDPDKGKTYPRLWLDQLSVAKRKTLGWYEIKDTPQPVAKWQRAEKGDLVFTGTAIEQSYNVIDKTLEEAQVEKLGMIEDEESATMDSVIDEDDRMIGFTRAIKLVRKEAKTSLTPAETAELDALEGLGDSALVHKKTRKDKEKRVNDASTAEQVMKVR